MCQVDVCKVAILRDLHSARALVNIVEEYGRPTPSVVRSKVAERRHQRRVFEQLTFDALAMASWQMLKDQHGNTAANKQRAAGNTREGASKLGAQTRSCMAISRLHSKQNKHRVTLASRQYNKCPLCQLALPYRSVQFRKVRVVGTGTEKNSRGRARAYNSVNV